MMSQDPCSVCGAKDLTLIDGFYYCVECGTQDVNACETVVEIKEVADGVLGNITRTKIKTKKETIEMSPEWTKWHTFNFILSGLGDELVALGAGDNFKIRLLDVWTRYMNIYYVKEDFLSKSHYKEFYEEDVPKADKEDSKNLQTAHLKRMDRLSATITYPLFVSMIYVALNLERSDILLSHLQRFISEGHITSGRCTKYIPKELNTNIIPRWISFTREHKFDIEVVSNIDRIRSTAMSILKKLKIGVPVVPDLRKIVDNCIKELCLPNYLKNLVFSLMELVPCDFLELEKTHLKSAVRIPDYEGTVMAYILVALKMCFGLDDSYELELSKDVDDINSKESNAKSYKIGSHSNLSNRLFNFQEWCNYLEFRKIILSKYYLPIAQKTGLDADDYVFMEHSKERKVIKKTLHEEITMEILDKLSVEKDHGVINKSEFVPTLTPWTTYTEVVLQYLQDPDRKILLSEDFTQYSLKYACVELKLPTKENNIFEGVNSNNFKIDKNIYSKNQKVTAAKADHTMIFIKNCENKNWLKTKQPEMEHVTEMKDDDDENDHGYDSNQENDHENKNKDEFKTNNNDQNTQTQEEKESDLKNNHDDKMHQDKNDDDLSELPNDNDVTVISIMSDDTEVTEDKTSNITEVTIKLEPITEDDGNIFDDDFADLYEVKKEIVDIEETNINNQSMTSIRMDIDPNNTIKTDDGLVFDPTTFNREETIKELVLAACKEFKVGKPPEYCTRKRKQPSDEAMEIRKRKRPDPEVSGNKTKPGEVKKEMEKILTAYYENMERMLQRNAIENVFAPDNEVTNHIETYNDSINDDRNIENELNNTEINTTEDNNRLESTDDSSYIVEGTIQDQDDNILAIDKNDPRYDEKVHDIQQLYLKFKNKFDVNDILKPDEDIEKLIEQQIDKRSDILEEQCITKINDYNENDKPTDSFDEDDDCMSLDKIKSLASKSNSKNPCKEFLINEETIKKLKSYKYWQRIYPSQTYKAFGANSMFYEDLEKEFPKSFRFVLTECASVINSTPLLLYNLLQTIECKLAALRKRR